MPTPTWSVPAVDTDIDIQRFVERCPPYQVILHNDDHHGMDEVIVALCRSVPGIGEQKAVMIMLEAHYTGRAVVIVCPQEQAEFYAERLGTYGLTVTIEQAPE